MCGVAGIFSYRFDAPPVNRQELRTLRDSMALRGPDGAGEWYSPDGRVGLAHRRLSFLDLSENGSQPMLDREGTLAVSFNGEIYNYREIRVRLEQKGYRFKSDSDTEVLLYLYREKGEGMVADLRGMFAFILWDGDKQRMLIARDKFGIKPLYYLDDKGVFKTASQVKTLLKAESVDTATDPAGHVGFFVWGYVP